MRPTIYKSKFYPRPPLPVHLLVSSPLSPENLEELVSIRSFVQTVEDQVGRHSRIPSRRQLQHHQVVRILSIPHVGKVKEEEDTFQGLPLLQLSSCFDMSFKLKTPTNTFTSS